MAEKIISALIQGGKATAGPPIGPALGPMGINAGKVVAEINEKTKQFEGITVPVKIIVDTSTKEYRIEVGTPPISALIKKEIGLEKGSGKAKEENVGNISIDQIIKIAQSKQESLLSIDTRKAVKEVLGACVSMGIHVEGKEPIEVQKEVDEGVHDDKILGKVELKELSKEEIAKMQEPYQKAIAEKEATVEAEKAAVAAVTAGGEKKLSKKEIKAAVALEKKTEVAEAVGALDIPEKKEEKKKKEEK